MTYPFKEIIILFNPNSTGPSKKNAEDLQKALKKRLSSSVRVLIRGTKNIAHAEEIGESYAKKDSKTLLISSSGDGGYNELVNGVLSHTTKNVAVVVMPSGNANDHHHATTTKTLKDRIITGAVRMIDVIEVQGQQSGKPWKRYAHSYVGVGLTAYIGEKLTKANLNPIKEKWLVLKYMLKFDHVSLQLEDVKQIKAYSNLIFANIDRMSKVIRLSKESKIDDGKFEVYSMRSASIVQLLRYIVIGSTIGFSPRQKTKQYEFVTKRSYKIQLDGEVSSIDKGRVKIVARQRVLRTLK